MQSRYSSQTLSTVRPQPARPQKITLIPAVHQPRIHRRRPQVTFFSLPLEVKNATYAGVVVSKHLIHIVSSIACHAHQHFFSICPIVERDNLGHCDCRDNADKSCLSYLDTGLLATSEDIAKEVLSKVFSANAFRFEHELDMSAIANSFGKMVGLIRRLVVLTFSADHALNECEKRFKRETWEAYLGVHDLSLEVSVELDDDEYNEEVALNYFRVLSFLPLASAKVKVTPLFASGADECILCSFEERSCALLLRDPLLPEELQVEPPELLSASPMKADTSKLSIHTFVPGLVTGGFE